MSAGDGFYVHPTALVVHELGANRWVIPDDEHMPGYFTLVAFNPTRHEAFAWSCTCPKMQAIMAMGSQSIPPRSCSHVPKVWALEGIYQPVMKP